MAEVLGVIASGIAVAQIAGTSGLAILKLKQLWTEVKNAPDDIDDLMEQVDCLDPTLWEAERHFSDTHLPAQLWDDTAVVKSAEYCRKALRKFSEVIDELALHIRSKRRIDRGKARLRVVLKKEELKSLEQHLRRAIEMLQFAQSSYIITLLKLQPEIIAHKVVSQLEQGRCSLVPNLDEFNCSERDTEPQRELISVKRENPTSLLRQRSNEIMMKWKKPSAYGRLDVKTTQEGYQAQYQPPWWLAGVMRAHSLQVSRSYTGFKMYLRSYCIRPINAPPFKAVIDDNVPALQAMFDSREASPFDRTDNGWTILHCATMSGSLRTIAFFHEMGLDIDTLDFYGFTAVQYLLFDPKQRKQQAIHTRQLVQILRSSVFLLPEREEAQKWCQCPFSPDWELFQALQPLFCPAHGQTILRSRVARAREIAWSLFPTDPRILKFVLSPDWNVSLYDPCNFTTTYRYFPLIHTVAILIRKSVVPTQSRAEKINEDWLTFAREVLRHTRDVHALEYEDSLPNFLNYNRGQVSEVQYAWRHEPGWVTPLSRQVLPPIVGWVRPNGWRTRLRYTECQWRCLMRSNLHCWLRLVKEANIDLLRYGCRENELLRTNGVIRDTTRWNCSSRSLIWDESWSANQRLIGFKIGSEVEDWDVLWNEPTDEFAGDFWYLVEDCYLHVPGAWCD
ncbi:hypothetical protein F5Y19DRAFT_83329 [Xylariaceae sp. FL1651]|nr:hypothetical protein F5Y19DRAFT_83329 [Xylariaceae sp. FL1651]